MTVATDVIKGTTIDDWIIGISVVVGALATLAALAHKPPVRTIGRGIGWMFGRLIGEPIAAWYTRNFREHAEPIVAAAVEKAIAPVKEEVAGLRDELRAHVDDETRADEAAQKWRDEIATSVRNLEQAQAPHLGARASTPDPAPEDT